MLVFTLKIEKKKIRRMFKVVFNAVFEWLSI